MDGGSWHKLRMSTEGKLMQNSSDISVTQWIADLKDGEESAAQQALWQRYFNRLAGLAREKLGGTPRAAEDEEDVVLSALGSFFSGMRDGEFPDLHDRNGLWPLLARITACKAINQQKRQLAAKRGGGRVIAASVAAGTGSEGDTMPLEFVDQQISPASLVELSEQCEVLLAMLPEEAMRDIATRKLAGYSTQEIADALEIAPRTVERKTSLIRRYWSEYAERNDSQS